MKRIYVAAIGAVVIACLVLFGYVSRHSRTNPAPRDPAVVYAYADVEHIMMSHPEYSNYHHIELEYNAMIARYQFEQWNYSQKESAHRKATGDFANTDTLMTAALDQELKARVAVKENELNQALKQKSEALLQEKVKVIPSAFGPDDLKIVNLQLQLNSLTLTTEERQSLEQKLDALMKSRSQLAPDKEKTVQDISAVMAPAKEKAAKELAAYAIQVKKELQERQQNSHQLFNKQIGEFGAIPEPEQWNQEWKDKLDRKEQELKTEKEIIMADIRSKAAVVAQEQGIELIFSEYLGYGTAIDVTDDIIAKLA
jgi:hypothetical protein